MEKRYFAFRKSSAGKEEAVFTGRQPRQAALKAASRGNSDIFLRERGTKKLHHFKGARRKVSAPANRPDWMAAMVWKPNVKKVGLIKPMKKVKAKAKKAKAKKVKAKKRRR
ncbi:chromosomal protein MC1 [Candidatus Micrarchaeota archaeon]|nr:chromosomal protein MC1 [Candidatus Micrarchaeota archaeon]